MFRHPEPSAAVAASRSLTRAVVVSFAVILAITGVFTLPPASVGAVPVPGQWEGQKGSIADGSGGTTAGTFLAAGASPAGDAQFTYDVPISGGDGEAGTWSFFTTAGTDDTVGVPFHWTGLHAWFNVTAGLDAVVMRGEAVVSTENLVDAGPEVCCTTPSNGFEYRGTASFDVLAGDVYGFVLRGANGDFNDFLRGELTIGTEVPESCADAQALYDAFVPGDGRYVINPAGGQRFTVHCADMLGAGLDYLEIRGGAGMNFSSYAAGGAAIGSTVTTSFTKVRLDPAALTVDVGDLRFATSTGSLVHPDSGGDQTVTSMPYATAMGCEAGLANGTANINLQGTPFAIDDTFGVDDLGVGSATFSALDQVVDLTGGGFCGWTAPEPLPFNPFNPATGQFILDLRYLNEPVASLSTPVLFASIARSSSTADLYALVDGAQDLPVTVEVRTSASCSGGSLDSPNLVATVTQQTDADGYLHLEGISGIGNGTFVTITVTAPTTTGASACIRTTADNDAWPKALPLAQAATTSVSDVIEVDGRARWYRFPIVPNQRITVTLSGVPDDYNLSVYRDIGKEFESQLVPQDADDLHRLSAEFAPSVFSPSVFSPSVFSPSVFSPDAYAPSVFSPSVFSPSVFSPSVFSPSVFSPSVFSPSVFSPSVFSPSVFSPSVFSPSVFSPSVFSPSVFSETELAQAFSSAQSRSLIGVSAAPGTGNETVVVNSWNNSGSFYVRVAGQGGAFDSDELFSLTVQRSASSCSGVTDTAISNRSAQPDAGTYATVLLTDSSRLDLGDGSPASLAGHLTALAGRTEVDGVIVDVAADGRVQQLRTQAAAHPGCPFAMNLVAEEIKTIVDSYRSASAPDALRYVTIVGDDTVVPFFRYPDQSLLGQESGYFPPVESDSISEASLRRDYVLSQDAYGAGVEVDIRTSAFPVPGLAVGRLVETPAEIIGMIDAYTDAGGVVSPDSSLVTGYDFLTDAADGVSEQLATGGTTVDELITDADVSPQQLEEPGLTDPRRFSWNADDLRDVLLEERHDLIFLAGHFSANSALAADYQTQVITTELADSSVDLENAVVISAGCHAGYNLVDEDALAGVALPLDWAQAFAQKRAVLVAGTGYQYGDTDFLEYSERLYRDFTEELRAGPAGSAVSVGEALVNAKRTYLATTPDIRGIHEKALLEATLFGLPMFGVNMPAGRGGNPGGASPASITPTAIASGPAATLGLATHDLTVSTPFDEESLELDVVDSSGVSGSVTATWLEGPDGVVTNPAEPAIPKDVVDATSTTASHVLRGVGFRGGTYTDTAGIIPLTGAPTTELRGVHAPFVSPVFYPMRMWTPNYFGELDGTGGTNLIVTPVQHRSDPATPSASIRRAYDALDLRLFYVDSPTLLSNPDFAGAALSDAPTIVSVETAVDGADLVFRAEVVGDPKAAIHEVWVVWTDGSGTWLPLDLQQCTAPLPVSCDGLDDSRVWTARLAGAPASLKYVAQAANGVGLVAFDDNRGSYYSASTGATVDPAQTTLTLVGPPTAGGFGQTVNVTAELKSGGTGLANKQVLVEIGGAAAIGVTGSNGRVTLPIALNSTPGPTTTIEASFAGDDAFEPSNASSPFSISKARALLSLVSTFVTVSDDDTVGMLTTLTARLGSTRQPLASRSVTVVLVGGREPIILSLITDYLGRVRLPPDVPRGGYLVLATFPDDETYTGALILGGTRVVDFDFRSPIDVAPTVNVVKAGNTVPIKFDIDGNHGLNILDGTPRIVPYTCVTGAPQDEIEQTTSAKQGLTYDKKSGLYQYAWKTPKNDRGCFRVELTLDDGSTHVALFRLR